MRSMEYYGSNSSKMLGVEDLRANQSRLLDDLLVGRLDVKVSGSRSACLLQYAKLRTGLCGVTGYHSRVVVAIRRS